MDPLSLVLGAAGALAGRSGLHWLRDYKSAPSGLSDLVDWDSFAGDPAGESHILRLYSGGLVAFYRFEGPNLALASEAEQRKTAEQIGKALQPLGAGWMFHIDVVRAYKPLAPSATHFSSAATALIEEERLEAFNSTAGRLLQTDYVLALTFTPDTERDNASKLLRPLLGAVGRGAAPDRSARALLAQYRKELGFLKDRLAGVLGLRAMEEEEILRHLHYCLTGLSHPVRSPGRNMALGDYLADQPLFGGLSPRIGRHHLRIISPHMLPDWTAPEQLIGLLRLPFPLRWSTRFIPLSNDDARRRIRSQRHQWIKRRKDAMATLRSMFSKKEETAAQKQEEKEFFENKTARRYAKQASDAETVLDDGQGRFGLLSAAVVLTGADEQRLAERARRVRACFRDGGFPARTEELGAMSAFHGSLPGNGYANPRRFMVHTGNLGDLFPAHRPYGGRAHNPSSYFPEGSPPILIARDTSEEAYRLHLHASGDVGHTLVVGATGAGKSMLVNAMLAQWDRYAGSQSFLFDVGYSGLPLAEAMGAAHYELHASRPAGARRGDQEEDLRPQPLRHLGEPGERAWAASWLELYFELQGLSPSPAQRRALQQALALIGENLPPERRTLSRLREQIQDEALQEALAPVTPGGPYPHLFDGREAERAGRAAHQVYELSRVRQLSSKVFTPLLAYLFHRVERQLSSDRPSLIVLEEAWSALGEPAFAERVQEWFLTLRKKNASLVFVAHTLSQLQELGALREVIVDSCQTKIYLPNAEAEKPENAHLYHKLGLNDQEIAALANAKPKRHYFIKSAAGAAMVDLQIGPLTLRTLTRPEHLSVPRYRDRVAALRTEHGEAWFGAYLQECGLAGWADRYTQARQQREVSGQNGATNQENGRGEAEPTQRAEETSKATADTAVGVV